MSSTSALGASKKTLRTPPPRSSAILSSCELCQDLDNDSMVQCDRCDKWYHFACVNVTSSISEKDFTCGNCGCSGTQDCNTDRQSIRSSSRSSSKHKGALLLKKLEEERKLEMQFLERKYKLLSTMDTDDEEPPADIPVCESQNAVSKWISDPVNENAAQRSLQSIAVPPQQGTFTNSAPMNNSSSLQQTITIPVSRNVGSAGITNLTLTSLNNKPIPSVLNQEIPTMFNYVQREIPVPISCQNQNCFVPRISETVSSAYPMFSAPTLNTFVQNPSIPSSGYNNFNSLNSNQPNLNFNRTPALNSSQLAARHVISKELPIFSGNPNEWPIFISCYEGTTRVCGFSNEENLIRLQRALKGKALEAVRSRLLLPHTIPNVIATLRLLYGRPEVIIHSLLQNIKSQPSPKVDRLETLITYALSVQNLCATIEASGLVDHLCNPTLMQELVDKLPAQIKLSWALFKQSLPSVTLPSLGNWLFQIAQAASEVTMPQVESSQQMTKSERRLTNERGYLHVHEEDTGAMSLNAHNDNDAQVAKKCIICERGVHKVDDCFKFRDMNLSDKWHKVKECQLCRKCLKRHNQAKCKVNKICAVNGCQFKHHPLLHNKDKDIPAPTAQSTNTSNPTPASHSCYNTHHETNQSILFRVIPVTLYGPRTSLNTYAFLDEGSSVTLIEDEIANELAINGTTDSLCLKWTANTIRYEPDSRRLSIKISGTHDNATTFKMSNVRTVKKLSLPVQSVSYSDLSSTYTHLQELPFESYNQAIPRILIGIDNWRLGLPLEAREGENQEPVATKTRLGWAIHGHYKSNLSHTTHKHYSLHMCDCQPDKELHELVKHFFNLENIGIKVSDAALDSRDNTRAKKIMETTTRKVGTKYETGLLWKYDHVVLPDSYHMAHNRFICLEKQMSRNPELGENIRQMMGDYETKGYIRKMSAEEAKAQHPRTWYLPLFTVVNPNKPGKRRIVWDAAAKVNGISLNSALLQGPDQVTPLLHVIFKFRERPIAVIGDIREMFHQVLIRKEDQESQRFLWKSDPHNSKPDTYIMQVMTFGATCSPSSAQYVKNLNANQYLEQFPTAVHAIIENHYVDDMLISVNSIEEAIKLSKDIRFVHHQGGFEIRNWVSNSTEVLEALGETKTQNVRTSVFKSEPCTEKALGMLWSTSSDTFTYSLKLARLHEDIISGKRRPTKREVLRTLMSIFDPLGLISVFVICGKILLKDIWKSVLEWDDPLSNELFNRWLMWLQSFHKIEQLHIPRCYSRVESTKHPSIQLHVFVDASESAYAAVAYFRIESEIGVECSLIAAKTKVAPQKPVSIPRLELQAAVLGTRLANNIIEGHSFKISRCIMWTDSRTVLAWLQSDCNRYRQFVAFRVGEILESTNPTDWRWIPSKRNVADDATKWTKGNLETNSDSRWFTGPQFLVEPESQWPLNVDNCTKESCEELKQNYFHGSHVEEKLIDVYRFSNWLRLLRTMAYVFRFTSNSKFNTTREFGAITPNEYKLAENLLYKLAQSDHYSDEIHTLRWNDNHPITMRRFIPKSSTIYKCSPYLDDSGVLRTRGRIDAAEGISDDTKRPILLPKQHKVTQLIVEYYHRKYHHHNHETVINEVRQRYNIATLRSILKKTCKLCQRCKILRAIPRPPEMGNLPYARLASFTRPFTYVGIDYFGPMQVTVGRRVEKRWGVLFTCLTIRAIHLEIASSLSTDSCILALRNFISRRGMPQQIFSDNGTNFRGANEELRRELLKLNNNKLQEETLPGIPLQWSFNPPAAPHMGGSWERLIRSVKTTLKQIMPGRSFSEELLRSLLMEVELIINSRPLTYIPLGSSDHEALTPNHFLLGSTNGEKPMGEFGDHPLLLRKNWKVSQQLANMFWKRWVREYLPDLTRRTKWFEKVEPIKIGDLVVIVDENQPRNIWKRGRVLETTSSRSGQVRQAIVQTNNGILTRPAAKLAVLDIHPDGEAKEMCTRVSRSLCDPHTGREDVTTIIAGNANRTHPNGFKRPRGERGVEDK